MNRIIYFICTALLLSKVDLSATNYYVSTTGSNTNNGLTASSPFRDIQKAADLTKPGDTVLVMNGTYNNSCSVCDGVNISKSGTATSYIVYKAYANHKPKIRFSGWQGIRIWGASYIEINGFDIEGNNSSITLAYAQSQKDNVNNPTTSGNGIYIDPNGSVFPHHVRIRNNNIYNCGGHGIGSRFTDYITIENNSIYNNAWYSPLGCSGISLYQNKNFDSFSGYRIWIRNNKIYNNLMNIPFFYNGKLEDGNGIIIDDAKNTQNGSPHGVYTGAIKIENNVVFDNGGRGIHAYLSNNVHVVNNTTYMNCKSPEVKDGELSGYGGDNLRFYNNVTYSRSDARANHNGDGASTNIIFDYNIYYNFSTSRPLTKGPNDIVADPRFVNPNVNPTLANFRLQATSPGINTGSNTLAPASDIENVLRPQGAAIDRGAYEFRSGTNTPPSVSITAPANNASFTVGAAILITANATDTDGTIAKVEFFQGATKIGEDLTSPYSFSWTGAAIGTYTLTAKATDNAAATSTSAPVSISISGTTTGSCVIKPIPDATKYELRNGWNDQNNGSKVSNTADALQISHRAWGSPYIWVIESGTPYVVSTGKHYNVSFDFKDDANIKASAIQVAFVSVIGNGGDPTLLQPAVTASSGYSSTTFTTETASILASTGGTAYLSFKLNWSGQPNLILNDYVKNITICEVSPTARWAADDTIEDLNIYPNPASQQVTIKHDFSNDEILQIQLMDATGMLHNTYQGYGKESTIELDADLSPGLYLLKVKGSNKEKVYRFIKE